MKCIATFFISRRIVIDDVIYEPIFNPIYKYEFDIDKEWDLYEHYHKAMVFYYQFIKYPNGYLDTIETNSKKYLVPNLIEFKKI